MENSSKEFQACASAKSTQAPAHHRIYQTQLWKIVHGEAVDSRGAEEVHQTDMFVADNSAQANTGNILIEFLTKLQEYCRKEKHLNERLRTLRFTRSGLITAAHNRTHIEAGKKCGHPSAYRRGGQVHRRRVGDYSYGACRTVCRFA